MLLWNEKTICPPPIYTIPMNIEDIHLSRLETVCSTAVIVLSNQKPLHIEAAALSRVLYRMKCKFRNDKGFKSMEKVNRGLLQYLTMDLLGSYKRFTDTVPKQRKASVYIPTRQMLEWLLVRTQGFAKLFCYIAQACRDAALYLHLRLNTGHVWNMALLNLALVSRIWSVAKYLVNCACEWYNRLKPFLKVLQSNGQAWLPPGHTFPTDLTTWLDATWLTQQSLPKVQKPLSILDKVLTGTNIDDNDNDNDNDNAIFLENTLETEASVAGTEVRGQDEREVLSTVTAEEDIGEFISRREAAENNKKKSKKEMKATSVVKHIPLRVTKNGTNIKLMKQKYVKNMKFNLDMSKVSHIVTKNSLSDTNAKSHKSKVKYTESNTMCSELGIVPQGAVATNTGNKYHKSKTKCIRNIKTCSDLELFLDREMKLRDKCSKACVTHDLDKLQWNMFYKAVSVYVKKLRSESVKNDKELCKMVMKKARSAIKIRIM